MKKLLYVFCLLLGLFQVKAQEVPLNSVIEHFTNTKCSVCATRNPGFITNYRDNASNFLLLSIHPSSPYASCPLSQQNNVANDARTNYYGLYGSTPRLAINGSVISASADYSNASLFTPYLGLTTPFEMTLDVVNFTADSVLCTAIIKKRAASALTDAHIFIALAEDTVFLNGGNGELEHYGVLRSVAGSASGNLITLPTVIGDSVVFTLKTLINPNVNVYRTYGVALLQRSDNKLLLQSAKTDDIREITGIENIMSNHELLVYPNPANDFLFLKGDKLKLSEVKVFDLMGKLVFSRVSEWDMIEISTENLRNGIYVIKTEGTSGNSFSTFVVNR